MVETQTDRIENMLKAICCNLPGVALDPGATYHYEDLIKQIKTYTDNMVEGGVNKS